MLSKIALTSIAIVPAAILLAVSDAVWKDLIVAVQTVLLAIIAPFAAWAIYKLNKIGMTGDKSHDLANSFMLEQKRKLSIVAREKADITTKEADIAIAVEAEAAYDAHLKTDERMKKAETK